MATKPAPAAKPQPKPKTMTQAEMSEMLRDMMARLMAIEAAITGTRPPTDVPTPSVPTSPGMGQPGRVGPGLVTIHGMTFELREPIAADWVPPLEGVLGSGYVGGQHKLEDPSNGWKVGQPMRSAAGYPINYAVTRDANGRDIAQGRGLIYFAGQPFESDGEVEGFKVRTQGNFGNVTPAAAFKGDVGVWDLTQQDKVYLAQTRDAYRQATGKDIMRDDIVAGRMDHINAAMDEGIYLRDQGSVSMANYSSALKDIVEKRMAGASK